MAERKINDIIFNDIVKFDFPNKINLHISPVEIDFEIENNQDYKISLDRKGGIQEPQVNFSETITQRNSSLTIPSGGNVDNSRLCLVLYNTRKPTQNIIEFINSYNSGSESGIVEFALHICYKYGENLFGHQALNIIGTKSQSGSATPQWFTNFASDTDTNNYLCDRLLYDSFSDTYKGYIGIASNMPLFGSLADAENYIINGVKDGTINKDRSLENTPDRKWYYYDETLYRTRTGSFDDREKVEQVHLSFYVANNDGRVCGSPVDSVPYNVHFRWNDNVTFIDGTFTKEGVQTRLNSLNDINNYDYCYTSGNNVIFDGTYYYFVDVSTNIDMFRDSGTATSFLDYNVDSDVADNGGKPFASFINRTGFTDSNQELNEADLSNDMSPLYICNKQALSSVANDLFSDDTNVIDEIISGLQLYGNNPIDFVNGLYYSPIDLEDFCTAINTQVKLGKRTVPNSSSRLVASNKKKTLFQTFINESFGNFLDYTNVSIALYLPFCGIVPLNFANFINTTMKVDVVVDIRNASMKYYIYSNNCVIMMKECNFGSYMSVVGTDTVGKMREDIQAFESVPNMVSSLASGNIGSVVNGVINASIGMTNNPSIIQSSSQTSGASCFDILYPYLIIDTQSAIIPSNLYKEYGVPCNKVQKLANCKGWTECQDIKLVGSFLSDEKDEIIQLLTQGVIL